MDSKIFVVLGMPRSGTTFLYHTLADHPRIFVPYRKESLYFSVNYDKGEGWYRDLYKDQASEQIGADVNPLYYLDPLSLDRILSFDPNIKVILSVRNPIDFAISHHGNMEALGWNLPPVTEMVLGYDWQVSKTHSLPLKLAEGFMESRINEIREKFQENVLFYDFEFFQASPLDVVKEIETFLGIPQFFDESNFKNIKINASGRRNIPLLNYLLTKQGLLDSVYAVVPDSLIRRGRTLFDRLSVARSKPEAEAGNEQSVADRRMLGDLLASDLSYYRELFASGPVQRGTADIPGAAGL